MSFSQADARVSTATAAPTFTLDQAVARARDIDRQLATGELTTPWPPEVHADVLACHQAFAAWCTTNERAKDLVCRLMEPMLPW